MGQLRADPRLLVTEPWADYGLIDSGDGRKLERYGPLRIIRPESQAMWPPAQADWSADATFVGGSDEDGQGRWRFDGDVPDAWPLAWQAGAAEPVTFWASCTPFRHLAFFPDMAPQWAWMAQQLDPARHAAPPLLLNLFGYTGVASLVAARCGAEVTHVDASKKSISAARANQQLSHLDSAPVRWIVDDALKFIAREERRGKAYQGVLLDPPKYGRGPNGEVWHLEEKLPALLAHARAVVASTGPRFVILTAYAIRLSALALGEAMASAFAGAGGQIEIGEMAVREEARGKLLPTAIFARWHAD